MRPLHWTLVQDQLRGFPMPKDLADEVRRIHTGLAVERVGVAYRERFRLEPIPGMVQTPGAAEQIGSEITGLTHAMAVMRVMAARGLRIYKIAKEFGEVLADVKCDVPPRYLRFDNEIVCIEFPDGMSFDMQDGDEATCAYVGMFAATEDATILNGSFPYMIDLTVPLFQDEEIVGNDNVTLYLGPDTPLDEELELSIAHIAANNSKTGFSKPLLSYIVNCLLYINSGDPDLRDFRPERKPNNAKDLKRWAERKKEFGTLPITLVGFDYKKPRQFHTGEAFVKSHRRWQPFGPRREKVKLIWVRAHKRHYKAEGST